MCTDRSRVLLFVLLHYIDDERHMHKHDWRFLHYFCSSLQDIINAEFSEMFYVGRDGWTELLEPIFRDFAADDGWLVETVNKHSFGVHTLSIDIIGLQ